MTAPRAVPTVEQGPAWVAELLFAPPPWVRGVLTVVPLVVLGVVGYRLHQRDWTLDAATQLQMGRIAATIVGVAGGVGLLRAHAQHSYLVDVAGGLAIGWGLVTAALSGRVRAVVHALLPAPAGRLAVGWALLGVVTVGVWSGTRTTLFGGYLLLTLLAGGLAVYNAGRA